VIEIDHRAYREIEGGVGAKFSFLNRCNSAADYSISQKFSTEFATRHSRYTTNVHGQRVEDQGHSVAYVRYAGPD